MSASVKKGTQATIRRLCVFLSLSLALWTIIVGVASPAQASAPVILSGSAWLNGQGVNVCGASTDPYCGDEHHVGGWSGNWWQCVELAQRFYQSKGWHGGIFANVSYAYQIYDQASALGMSRQTNGSITSIMPGDMIIHASDAPGSGGAGHVSIVESVNGSTVNAVEQNASSTGRAVYSFTNGALSRAGTGTIRGVVHDPNNSLNNGGGATPSPGRNLIENGSFGGGTSSWTVAAGGNFAVYTSGGPQSGVAYGATNGGGVYQDIPQTISQNQAFCATAEVRTAEGGTGASGIMKIWQLGGSYNDGEDVHFTLGSTWKQIKVCGVATTSHSSLRLQFYPAAGSPTIDIDDVNMHQSLANNASFGGGTAGWTVSSGANFTTYAGGSTPPQSGVRYAATNGGGFYQDVPLTITPNQAFCATAEVRTGNGSSGASGILKLWQLGGSYNDGEQINFSSLTSSWKQIKVCGVATTAHTTLRIQFYTTSGHTLDVDDVDVHRSLANNASFGGGTAGWTAATGGNFAVYTTGGPQSGVAYAATNGAGIYQDIPVGTAVNDTICVTAEVRTADGQTGATGILKIWQLGGSYNDGEDVHFGPLGNTWKQIKVCGVATTAHTSIRVQFYPTANTLDIDDVDIH